MRAIWTDENKLKHLAADRTPRQRGAGQGRRRARARTSRRSRPAATNGSPTSPASSRARRNWKRSSTTTSSASPPPSPRRSTTTPAAGSTSASPAATSATPAYAVQMMQSADILIADVKTLLRRHRPAREGTQVHALHRPQPRHPRRADDLRPQARADARRIRPRPAPPRIRRAKSSPSAKSPAPSAPARTCRRASRLTSARSSACAPRPSPRRSCSATSTPSSRPRWPSSARASSAGRSSSAICNAPKCSKPRSRSPRARKAAAPCRTSATPSPGNASPASPACCAATPWPSLENVALWHERDISHSSVERIIFPDSCTLLDYMFGLLTRLMDGLVVYPENMKKNLGLSLGMWNSQTVLLALIRKGLTREAAYKLVPGRRDEDLGSQTRRPRRRRLRRSSSKPTPTSRSISRKANWKSSARSTSISRK